MQANAGTFTIVAVSYSPLQAQRLRAAYQRFHRRRLPCFSQHRWGHIYADDLAGSIAMIGQPQRAARLLGAVDDALERMGAFHQPGDKPEMDRIIAEVRAQLDDATFQATLTQGRQITLEQAVANALAEHS